mmetsp:Transcript_63468/g.200736  ORF Transcript_63468/g.200736 Transcript_63468/m.200736 type:complete len:233 (+) Transcript_63468:359-1057(+)
MGRLWGGAQRSLLQPRVDLDLIHHRPHPAPRQQSLKVPLAEVAHPDGAAKPPVIEVLQRPPRLTPQLGVFRGVKRQLGRSRPVDQQEVQVGGPEALQAAEGGGGGLVVALLIRGDLGGEEELPAGAWHGGGGQDRPNVLFVLVDRCRIYVAVSELEGDPYRLTHFLPLGPVRAQPKHGHQHPVVQSHRGCHGAAGARPPTAGSEGRVSFSSALHVSGRSSHWPACGVAVGGR